MSWIIHAHFGSKTKSQSSSAFALMMKLLTEESPAFVKWAEYFDICENHFWYPQKQRDVVAKPLYYASMGGLTEASDALLEMGGDVDAQGGYYGNALQVASYKGHETTTKLLIEKGADVNAQGGFYVNACQAALNEGHQAIATLLIQKGADVIAQDTMKM